MFVLVGDHPAVAVNNCRVRFGIQYAVWTAGQVATTLSNICARGHSDTAEVARRLCRLCKLRVRKLDVSWRELCTS